MLNPQGQAICTWCIYCIDDRCTHEKSPVNKSLLGTLLTRIGIPWGSAPCWPVRQGQLRCTVAEIAYPPRVVE